MRDNDTILLESLYTSLVLEDAQSQINQAVNLIKKYNFEKTKAEKGGKIAPEEFEAFKIDNQKQSQEIVNTLKEIIDSSTPPRENPNFGKGYEFLPTLAKFYTQTPNITEIESLYKSYVSLDIPDSIKARKNKSINTLAFSDFATLVHKLESNDRELKKSNVGEEEIKKSSEGDFANDSNVVYNDENVIILSGTTEDIHESVGNCKKYGQGNRYGLCISGANAYYYYLLYRFNDGLSTYFVYFKDSNKNAKEGFIIVDHVNHDIAGSNMDSIDYQYNTITSNNDIKVASEEPIIKLFPELEKPFKEGVFKAVPLIGDELEIKEKVYRARDIFDPNIINNINLIKAFMIINNGSFTSTGSAPTADEFKKLEEALPDKYDEIINNYIELGPQLNEEIYNILKPNQQKRWEQMRLRKIEQAFNISEE